jgi:hypothetical protein
MEAQPSHGTMANTLLTGPRVPQPHHPRTSKGGTGTRGFGQLDCEAEVKEGKLKRQAHDVVIKVIERFCRFYMIKICVG